MGMMLVEHHQASFFGKLLESCRATKGRDSTPTDEARRSLARWARTAGHARPIMQRRGQTGAGFRQGAGDCRFLRERRRKPRSRAAGGRGKNRTDSPRATVRSSIYGRGKIRRCIGSGRGPGTGWAVVFPNPVLPLTAGEVGVPQHCNVWFRVIYLVNRVLLLLVTATTLLLCLPVVQTRDDMYPPFLS